MKKIIPLATILALALSSYSIADLRQTSELHPGNGSAPEQRQANTIDSDVSRRAQQMENDATVEGDGTGIGRERFTNSTTNDRSNMNGHLGGYQNGNEYNRDDRNRNSDSHRDSTINRDRNIDGNRDMNRDRNMNGNRDIDRDRNMQGNRDMHGNREGNHRPGNDAHLPGNPNGHLMVPGPQQNHAPAPGVPMSKPL